VEPPLAEHQASTRKKRATAAGRGAAGAPGNAEGSEAESRQSLVFDDNLLAAELYGPGDRTLKILEQELGVRAHARGNEVRLMGSQADVAVARKVLDELYACCRRGQDVGGRDVREAVRMVRAEPDVDISEVTEDLLAAVGSRRKLRAKNLAQRRYVELIQTHDVVLALGPAGTGKTYLAMAMAIAALNRHEVSRVILTRPAVEAGERLGFLPGDLAEKVNPYMRPLYDALHDMMDFARAADLMERDVIEVAPLAFMRGRTLNDSFIILDEAQNTTPEQMKMFLTRLGYNSRAVVTGDLTQTDLAGGKSGLLEATKVLKGVEGIGTLRFSDADVVRHPLVQSIIRAYERHQAGASKQSDESGASATQKG
jgi:phosphate starvation-inducible PhoH-like protein